MTSEGSDWPHSTMTCDDSTALLHFEPPGLLLISFHCDPQSSPLPSLHCDSHPPRLPLPTLHCAHSWLPLLHLTVTLPRALTTNTLVTSCLQTCLLYPPFLCRSFVHSNCYLPSRTQHLAWDKILGSTFLSAYYMLGMVFSSLSHLFLRKIPWNCTDEETGQVTFPKLHSSRKQSGDSNIYHYTALGSSASG